jgi:hypothetical protein
MIIILTSLVLAVTLVLLALLVALILGIHSDERATDLASQPRTLNASMARRLLGLHVRKPARPACMPARHESPRPAPYDDARR